MPDRYNLLVNVDRSLIEHSHGANYTTKFQEQVRKKMLYRCFLEIFLAEGGGDYFPIDLTSFQDQIFERFKRSQDIHLLKNCRLDWNKSDYKDEFLRLIETEKIQLGDVDKLGIDWNKKEGQESDYYKNEFLRLIETEKIPSWFVYKLGIDWNKKEGQESDYYKNEFLSLIETEKIQVWDVDKLGIDWNKKEGQESDYYKEKLQRFLDARETRLISVDVGELGLDWNKKGGQESDYYKEELFRILEKRSKEEISEDFVLAETINLQEMGWSKKDGQESDYYKDELLRRLEDRRILFSQFVDIKLDWNKKDGQESDYYKDKSLRLIKEGRIKSRDFVNIELDWNKKDGQESDYYKDELLKLIEAGKVSNWCFVGLEVDWNKKDGQESDYYKDKVLKLIESREIKSMGIGRLGLDWSKKDGQKSDYYKDKLLKLIEAGKIQSIDAVELGLKIDWNKKDGRESDYYTSKLLRLVGAGKIKIWDFVRLKVDWNKKEGQESDYYKDELLRFFDVGVIEIGDFVSLKVDWNKRNGQESDYYKDEIFKIIEKKSKEVVSDEFNTFAILSPQEIDWSRKEGQESDYYINRFLDVYYKTIPEFREIIDRVQQSYNPLEEIGLYKQLLFESGPHWKFLADETKRTEVSGENADTIKDNLESQFESKKRFLKSLLVGLYDMGTLQILAQSENQKIKKLTGSQVDTYPEDDSLKDVSFVDSLSLKELNVYLLFYINKMTKLNELTIYRRMLGNFTYNEELEAGLRKNKAKIESAENNTFQTPSPEIQKLLEYKREKEAAEDKADNLIAVFNELKAKYDDIVANNMSEKVGQKFPIYMESFTSFLQHYWEVKDNPDSKQIDGKSVNGQLLEFFELFNSKIDELQSNRY